MKITQVKYEQLFPSGNYLNARYGIEISCNDSEIDNAYALAFHIVNDTHKKQFPLLYDKEGKPKFNNYAGEEVPVVQQEKKLTGIDHWINEINKCTTIEKPDGIESMRTIADTNPKLKEVFNKRLEELKTEYGVLGKPQTI